MPEPCAMGPALSALLDGELPRAQHRSVAAHLDGCERCAAELAGLRRVRAQLRSLPMRQVPDDLLEPVVRRGADRPVRAGPKWAEGASVGVLVVAAAVTGALVWGGADDNPRVAGVAVEALVAPDVASLPPGSEQAADLGYARREWPGDGSRQSARAGGDAMFALVGDVNASQLSGLPGSLPGTDDREDSRGLLARAVDAVTGWWSRVVGR